MIETENRLEGSKVSLLPQRSRHSEGVQSPEETQSEPPDHELLRPAAQRDGRKKIPQQARPVPLDSHKPYVKSGTRKPQVSGNVLPGLEICQLITKRPVQRPSAAVHKQRSAAPALRTAVTDSGTFSAVIRGVSARNNLLGAGAQENTQQEEPWEAAGGKAAWCSQAPGSTAQQAHRRVTLHTHARKPAHVCTWGQAQGGSPGPF